MEDTFWGKLVGGRLHVGGGCGGGEIEIPRRAQYGNICVSGEVRKGVGWKPELQSWW